MDVDSDDSILSFEVTNGKIPFIIEISDDKKIKFSGIRTFVPEFIPENFSDKRLCIEFKIITNCHRNSGMKSPKISGID